MKEKILFYYYSVLWKLASYYIKRTKPYVVGVTGSIWKTSARMIISSILSKYLDWKKIYTSSKNFNWEFGMSLSILWISDYNPSIMGIIKTFFIVVYRSFFMKKIYDVVVLEYGIDHVGEMEFLLSICRPDFWIVTKIDKVHSMQFSNPDITASEKYKLIYESKDVVFLNKDDEYSSKLDEYMMSWVDKFYYTTWEQTDVDIVTKDFMLESVEWKVYSNYKLKIKNYDEINLKTNLLWKENMWYVWIWFVILDILNYKYNNKSFIDSSSKSFTIHFELQPWRFSFFEWINNSIIIDSSYNGAPWSMRKVIQNVCEIRDRLYSDYKLIFVLGEMRELGEFTKPEHEALAEYIYKLWDEFFLVWESMQKYLWPKLLSLTVPESHVRIYLKSTLAWNDLQKFLETAEEKYLVLFKWSQNTVFIEEAIKPIIKDKTQIKFLARQAWWWMEKKNKFFEK